PSPSRLAVRLALQVEDTAQAIALHVVTKVVQATAGDPEFSAILLAAVALKLAAAQERCGQEAAAP
ncbi:MAG TPA: hypothetical protein VK741_25845, partial [Acetobacteraceae bacterium]|nr:hypothetical protein [Acetobacteraceae bacterium]